MNLGSPEIIILLLIPIGAYVLGFFNGKSFWTKRALKNRTKENL